MLITCQNERIDRSGGTVLCGRFLAEIPDRILFGLVEGEVIKLRCPSCPSSQRFILLKRGLTWESTGEFPECHDVENNMEFKHKLTVKQIG